MPWRCSYTHRCIFRLAYQVQTPCILSAFASWKCLLSALVRKPSSQFSGFESSLEAQKQPFSSIPTTCTAASGTKLQVLDHLLIYSLGYIYGDMLTVHPASQSALNSMQWLCIIHLHVHVTTLLVRLYIG